MIYEYISISNDKRAEENISIIKSWADNLVDSLVMADAKITELQEKISKLESEGK